MLRIDLISSNTQKAQKGISVIIDYPYRFSRLL